MCFIKTSYVLTNIFLISGLSSHNTKKIVDVLSDSMEPTFHRGHLPLLKSYEQEDIRVGEIVVFNVHRVLKWQRETTILLMSVR